MSVRHLSGVERAKLAQVLDFAPVSTAVALGALVEADWDVQSM